MHPAQIVGLVIGIIAVLALAASVTLLILRAKLKKAGKL